MSKLYIENTISNRKGSKVLLNSEPAPVGFTESNTIEDWNYYGLRSVGMVALPTMLSLRTIIGELVATIGFDNCTENEKVIACQWVVVTKAQRDTVRTPIEQFNDNKNLLYNISTDYNELCLFNDDDNLVQIKVNSNNELYIQTISTF